MTKLKFADGTYPGEILEMGGDAIVARFYAALPASFAGPIVVMDGDAEQKTYTGYDTVCQIEGADVILTNSGRTLTLDYSATDLEDLRTNKKRQIGIVCTAAIHYGVDVAGAHYSLEETDQLNLQTAYSAIKNGAASYPYHADGELAKNFTADEITAIYEAADQHKRYHTTYCNHLNRWIARAETAKEVAGIYYGKTLPDDLKESMTAIVS